jgi:hypothetical protein
MDWEWEWEMGSKMSSKGRWLKQDQSWKFELGRSSMSSLRLSRTRVRRCSHRYYPPLHSALETGSQQKCHYRELSAHAFARTKAKLTMSRPSPR